MNMIPDDGYADGGCPYTDEEMEIIESEELHTLANVLGVVIKEG